MKEKEEKPKINQCYLYFLCFSTVISGFLFGYNTGVVSSAMLFIPNVMNLDYVWTQVIVSISLIACAIASLVSGPLNDRLGRKAIILISSAFFTVGAILLGSAQEKWMLLTGRLLIGIAIGLASMTAPLYLAELCPAEIRGFMVTGFQLMITLGIFIACLLGGGFSYIDPEKIGWRLMLGVPAIPALIQFISFIFLPESPRWLCNQYKDELAVIVLQNIYQDSADIEFEMEEIRSERETMKASIQLDDNCSFSRMLNTPHVRRALIVGCALQAFPQLSGINTIIYYGASIFKMSGVRDPSHAIWMSCIITGINFLVTFIPVVLVEKWGRRILWLGSLLGVAISLLILGLGFLLINRTAPRQLEQYTDTNITTYSRETRNRYWRCRSLSNCDDCVTEETCGFCYPKSMESINDPEIKFGYCLPVAEGKSSVSEIGVCKDEEVIDHDSGTQVWGWNFCPSTKLSWLPLLGMICYICAFAIGAGPMPWVINAEIYPYWARGTGVGVATFVNWTMNALISQTFLTLTETITKYGAFFLYCGIASIGIIIFYFVLPETKGIQMEEVEYLFGKEKNLQTEHNSKNGGNPHLNSPETVL